MNTNRLSLALRKADELADKGYWTNIYHDERITFLAYGYVHDNGDRETCYGRYIVNNDELMHYPNQS